MLSCVDSLGSYGLYSPWNSPGQNTGVGSLSLLQGIFLTQGLNPSLPHCRQILYQLSHCLTFVYLFWLRWVCVAAHRIIVASWLLSFSMRVGSSSLLLLSCFSRVRLCATPETAAHQAPPSLGFSRQEHWSGLPFPSPMNEKWKVKVKSLSHVWLLATPWTAAYQAPPSMGFSRQEYWSGLSLPSPLALAS